MLDNLFGLTYLKNAGLGVLTHSPHSVTIPPLPIVVFVPKGEAEGAKGKGAKGSKGAEGGDDDVNKKAESLELKHWGRKRHYSVEKIVKKKKTRPLVGAGEASAIKEPLLAKHLPWQICLPKGIKVYTDLNYLDAYNRALCHHFEVYDLKKKVVNLKDELAKALKLKSEAM
ncbi:hypothetical protein NE237_021742 [Protea cynaroides]|uniref:Uncharacterized protein n=1 Tax=Protea cynaroides TaxID=273540 RepID=A0A9Q0K3U2_9MAGN|nr:hypothetical protein NE237_021742 [Protea cynaroides]